MADIVKGKIGNALMSVAPDGIVATADAIYDETKGKSQEQINEDTEQSLAEQANSIGYYECGTAAATAAKEITGGSYKLPDAAPYGGTLKVKFTYKNSAANPTLSINRSPAKPLYYNGAIASLTNTWEDGDVLDLYYDGTNFNARSVVEKFATGEKVKNVGIDSEPTAGSSNLVKSGGVEKESKQLDLIVQKTITSISEINRSVGAVYYYDGQILNYSSYFYTEPIPVKKGDIIFTSQPLTVINNNVAIISEVTSTGTWCTTLLRTPENGNVIYGMQNDGYICISGPTSQIDKIHIISSELIADTIKNNFTTSYFDTNVTQINADKIVKGKYRKSTNGTLATNDSYAYTIPILVKKGDIVICKGVSSIQNVSFVTKVDVDGNALEVVYVLTEPATKNFVIDFDGYVSLSIMLSKILGLSIVSSEIISSIINSTSKIETIQEDVEAIDKTINGGELDIVLNDTNTINGKYRVITGSLSTMNAYFYSVPIKVSAGDKVKSTEDLGNISTSVSFISKVSSEGEYIETLVAGYSEMGMYEYTVEEDCYIEISALTSKKSILYVEQQKKSFDERITELESREIPDVDNFLQKDDTGLIDITQNPLATILRGAGYGGIIHSWGIIGDSLSSGEMQCYNQNSQSASDYKFVDMYQWSWGQRFAKLNGVDCYNFCNGGQTTWGWLKSQGIVHDDTYIGGVGGGDWRQAQQTEYLKDGYIIALGVNDRAKISNGDYILGSVDDIQTYVGDNTDIDDTTVVQKSFVRYYAGIIQRIKSVRPKAKIFCVTTMGSNYSDIAQKIREIVEHYSSSGVYLIDLETYSPIKDKWNPSFMYNMNGHGSSIGYEYTAYEINTYIDWIIRNNGNDFKGTALIGLENYREKYSE